jgi:hypothetical protein
MTVVQAATGTDWLRVFAVRPAARLRLFCFPHAGGAASTFRELARLAPPDIELVAVQYPGRQDRYGGPLAETLAEDATYRAGEQAGADREYWSGRLAGMPAPALLSEHLSGGPGAAAAPLAVRIRRTSRLPQEYADRLAVAARGCRTRWPLFAVAATAAFLHRVTGQREVVVGLPVTGRSTPPPCSSTTRSTSTLSPAASRAPGSPASGSTTPRTIRCAATPGTLPHCLEGVGGAPTRRTGRKPKYVRSVDGDFRPARREHAPDAAP